MADAWNLLGLLGGPSAAMSRDVDITSGAPSTAAQLFTGVPKNKEDGTLSFWNKPIGKAIGSILGMLAMGGLGAGLGAIVSPRARGLGAARGAGLGAASGTMMDIAQRRSASAAPANDMKLAIAAQQAQPTAEKVFNWLETLPEDKKKLAKESMLYGKVMDPYAQYMIPMLMQSQDFMKKIFDRLGKNFGDAKPSETPDEELGTYDATTGKFIPAKKGAK